MARERVWEEMEYGRVAPANRDFVLGVDLLYWMQKSLNENLAKEKA